MVRGLHKGFFFPREHVLIANLFRHLFILVQSVFFVRRSWTNDDVGNFFADTLPAEGSRMESEHENRILFPAEWSAEAFVRKRASPVGAGQRAVGYTCQKSEATSPKAKTKRPSYHRKIRFIASTATSVFGR